MKPFGMLQWNIKKIAEALRISEEDAKLYFTDGRRVSFIIERILAKEVFEGEVAHSEGADFDLIDKKGQKWEVRSLTKSGVYFCPSYMVGSGRSFNERGFKAKLKHIKGYVLADVVGFPNVNFWIINKETILNWWKNKQLGSSTKVSHDKIKILLSEI